MTLKVGEVGKKFRYATYFDLSGNTTISLKFKAPDGTINLIEPPRLTAPNIQVEDTDLGTLDASTYMEFTTIASDFEDIPDILPHQDYITWSVCGTYVDSTPKEFFGDTASFKVYRPC